MPVRIRTQSGRRRVPARQRCTQKKHRPQGAAEEGIRVQTVFFAADAAQLLRLAAAGGDPEGLDLACVDAVDLDPAQLLELDTLVTGHDPVAVREALLTP